MKIAYLGKIQLSDVDLSYLHEAQKKSDITCIMEITPRFCHGPAFNLDKVANRTGIFKATDVYPEFSKYGGFIDLDKFYILNISGKLWQLKAFWANFLLLLFLVRKGFDVIHVVWPLNIYEFVLYLLRRKMILTVHDPFPHTGLDTFIVRFRRKMAFRLVPKFILLNKAQVGQFSDFYKIGKNRIFVSKLSEYTYLHTVTPDFSTVPPEQHYILFIGKISRYKGLDYLLPAMEKVHAKYSGVKLVVAGGGKYHFDISKYLSADYIDIRNRFIPDSEMVALMSKAQFVVCPYTDATQSGVIMSAFAFRVPVLATCVGGLPEMVGNGRLGVLVKEKSVDALADGICELLGNDGMLCKLHDNIESAYSGNGELSWMTIANGLRDVYEELADSAPKHS